MLCSSIWRPSLQEVRTYRGADVGSDANFVIGRISWKLKRVKKVKTGRPHATDKLKNTYTSARKLKTNAKRLNIQPTLKSNGSYFFKPRRRARM